MKSRPRFEGVQPAAWLATRGWERTCGGIASLRLHQESVAMNFTLFLGSHSTIPLIVGTVAAVAVGLFAHVVGYDRDRSFYAAVLTVVGSLYVLFNVMAGGGPDLAVEIAVFGVFATLAAVGFRTSLWVVVAGLALHGVFDLFRNAILAGRGVPEFWPAFCGSYDVVAAIGLSMLLLAGPPRGIHAAGDETGNARAADRQHCPGSPDLRVR